MEGERLRCPLSSAVVLGWPRASGMGCRDAAWRELLLGARCQRLDKAVGTSWSSLTTPSRALQSKPIWQLT